MKRVLIVPTLLDAQLAVDTLASFGIAAHVLNANAAGASGEVPFLQAQPEIWVEDDAQAARAHDMLAALRDTPAGDDKTCPRCGEINPGNFLSCWQCGAAVPDQVR